jgi:phosphatidylserine decarboxylase
LSKVIGWFASLRLPRPLIQLWITFYKHIYKVNLDEAQIPFQGFRTFEEFFTRHLKPGVREIVKDENLIVSPVDGIITYFGKLESHLNIKGRSLNLNLIFRNSKYNSLFKEGSFLSIYLRPGDYHRIHSPINGQIVEYYYIPGALLPVSNLYLKEFKNLFLNERIVLSMKSQKDSKPFAIIMIGAFAVGKIVLSFKERRIRKGEELGVFKLGSTVLLIWPKDQIEIIPKERGKRIRIGEPIAYYLSKVK